MIRIIYLTNLSLYRLVTGHYHAALHTPHNTPRLRKAHAKQILTMGRQIERAKTLI